MVLCYFLFLIMSLQNYALVHFYRMIYNKYCNDKYKIRQFVAFKINVGEQEIYLSQKRCRTIKVDLFLSHMYH